MKFFILADDRCFNNENYKIEHGFSIYMEDYNIKILMDTGQTDIFIQNAKELDIDLHEIDKVVLSHGHYDHGNGLKYLKNKTLVLHPDCFTRRYSIKRQNEYSGIDSSYDDLSDNMDLIITKDAYMISDNIWFCGQIDRKYEIDSSNFPSLLENGDIDPLLDDTGIVIKNEDGIIVVAGCSHSGIDNIIETAKKVSGHDKVKAVIGGFHLKHINNYTKRIIEYFRINNIPIAYMGHCTSDEVIEKFREELRGITDVKVIYAGLRFEL